MNAEKPKSKDFLCYLFILASVQVCALAACFYLATTQWFLKHDAYPALRMIGYGTTLKQANCDVLLYGDSSSLTGLDPEIIERTTGMKSCNIAEGTTVLDVVGNFPLDEYLKNNDPPRYIVAMYTPSIFSPDVKPFQRYRAEGLTYALKYARDGNLYRNLLRHPSWLLQYSQWVATALFQDAFDRFASKQSSRTDPGEQRVERKGIWTFPLPPETDCIRTKMHLKASWYARYQESVANMRRRYEGNHTKVLINISPVPECDVLYERYAALANGLYDNSFERLPIAYFNEGDVHFSAAGSKYISLEAGRQIIALEAKRQVDPTPISRP